MARTDVKVSSERNPSTHDDEKRSRKFRAPLLFALLVVPAFGLLLRFIVFWAPEMLWLVAGLSLTTGFIYASAAVAIGFKVSKRIPLVIWHVAATGFLFGLALYITTVIRWPAETAPWYHRLLAVVNWPAWWVIVHLFGAVIVGGSWLLYRIDAFRAATGADEFSGGALAKFLKWPTGALIVESSIVADEHATEAKISHPGVPVAQVQAALPALVEYAGAVRGRSAIIPGERGGESTVRLVREDPLKTEWKRWPGLSHPGGSFAHPIRSGYYTNGEPQFYSFAQTPNERVLQPSRLAPKFRSENDAHFGRQGATRSGKSGDNAIEIAEILSRRDAIVCFANAAKLTQDVGWALEWAGLAAETKPHAHTMFDKLQRIGELRSSLMGDPRLQGRHRVWSPLTYDELGLAAIVLEVDEGDLLLNGNIVTWLSTKGLSLGIFMSVMISRAATDGMASTLRSAVTQWKAFGAGTDYDGGFVLDDKTIAAGADPGSLSTRFKGAHYLDKAQGVEERLYPELARSFQTAPDFSDLKAEVAAARATFDAPQFHPREREILGDAMELLSPAAVLKRAYAQIDGTVTLSVPAAAGDDQTIEGTSMETTQSLVDEDGNRLDATGDPELDALLAKPRADFSELEREFGPLPPAGEPMPDLSDPALPAFHLTGSGKPAKDERATGEEFDAAVLRLAERLAAEGRNEFGNKDVQDEMRCDPNPTFVSRRFTAMLDREPPKALPPEGLTIVRVPGRQGRYTFERLAAPGPGHTR